MNPEDVNMRIDATGSVAWWMAEGVGSVGFVIPAVDVHRVGSMHWFVWRGGIGSVGVDASNMYNPSGASYL